MKLNQTHKQAIVRAVIADIPRPNMQELEAFINKCVEQELERFCPKAIAEAWKDVNCRRYLALTYINVGYMVEGRKQRLDDFCSVSAPAYHSFSEQFTRTVSPKIMEMVGEVNAIEEARKKLEAAIAGIKTRKQFIETFPELEKYAPEEATVGTMLPALTNVVSDLSKLGWPKKQVVA